VNHQIPFLDELKQELFEHELQQTPTPRRPRPNGLWVAAAAFAATLLVGGFTWILAGGGSQPPAAAAPTLLDSFSSGDIVYEFRTYPNNQGPDAPCIGVTYDIETKSTATMACPTEESEESEYAAPVHTDPWTFVVGYGLDPGETIEVEEAVRVVTTEQVNGRRFFLIQFDQARDESFEVPVTRPDGTTRYITVKPPDSPPSATTTMSVDLAPADVGFEFANPEHVHMRFTQDLTLTCQSLETVDNGGFDSFNMDIWIDHQAGYTRLGIEYPDGSTHDLILKGRPGAWENAWGMGTDLGRDAGCREILDEGASSQSIAGWAFQDASVLWFTAYLKPVNPAEDDGVEINYQGRPTRATPAGPSRYVIEEGVPGETVIRREYTLDNSEIRVVVEQRHTDVSGEFEANATIEVLESGPTTLPPDIFDISDFTPLWGGDPVPTTEATTP
jgi:hypothetical protein